MLKRASKIIAIFCTYIHYCILITGISSISHFETKNTVFVSSRNVAIIPIKQEIWTRVQSKQMHISSILILAFVRRKCNIIHRNISCIAAIVYFINGLVYGLWLTHHLMAKCGAIYLHFVLTIAFNFHLHCSLSGWFKFCNNASSWCDTLQLTLFFFC